MSRTALERPALAVDVVLLALHEAELSVLLHRRAEEPFAGETALPGVAVRAQETLVDAARRALVTKAGIPPAAAEAAHLEQLATFDALFRDPRGRTVAVAYLGLATERPAPSAGGAWRPVSDIPRGSLPFDHDDVLATAVARLRGKLRYTAIARHLMPERFRVDELRAAYEAILGRRLNRSNFRSKLLRIGLIEQAGEAGASARGGRPPHLYRFAPDPDGDVRDFL